MVELCVDRGLFERYLVKYNEGKEVGNCEQTADSVR